MARRILTFCILLVKSYHPQSTPAHALALTGALNLLGLPPCSWPSRWSTPAPGAALAVVVDVLVKLVYSIAVATMARVIESRFGFQSKQPPVGHGDAERRGRLACSAMMS